MISPSSFDDDVASERGRLLAAHSIANSREKRAEMEGKLGKQYCQSRWPEAYKSSIFGNAIDKFKQLAGISRFC